MGSVDTHVDTTRSNLAALDGQQVAIVGYGHLGRPAALNLRDAGCSVVVGSRSDSANLAALADGFVVMGIEEAVRTSDVLWLALPDESIPEVLATDNPAQPSPGSLVCMSSGYPLAFELVKPPHDVDVVMLAPRMIGTEIRALHEAGKGFFSFISVEQDVTGTARSRLMALADGFGSPAEMRIEMPAAREAALDLFVEQTVGPYLGAAVLSAFETGVEHGLSPEALALELYLSGEMARTWQSFADHGFYSGVKLHGRSATFGGFVRMGEIDIEDMKRHFAATLEDITSGRFARHFEEELAAGSPTRALIDAMIDGDDPLSRAEASLRKNKEQPPRRS